MGVEFRVYYEPATGAIRFYTCEQPPGEYLVISAEEYALSRYDLTVKERRLVTPKPKTLKLVPGGTTGYTTDPTDVTIIAPLGTTWSIQEYDIE